MHLNIIIVNFKLSRLLMASLSLLVIRSVQMLCLCHVLFCRSVHGFGLPNVSNFMIRFLDGDAARFWFMYIDLFLWVMAHCWYWYKINSDAFMQRYWLYIFRISRSRNRSFGRDRFMKWLHAIELCLITLRMYYERYAALLNGSFLELWRLYFTIAIRIQITRSSNAIRFRKPAKTGRFGDFDQFHIPLLYRWQEPNSILMTLYPYSIYEWCVLMLRPIW